MNANQFYIFVFKKQFLVTLEQIVSLVVSPETYEVEFNLITAI